MTPTNTEPAWFEDYADDVDDIQVDEYDITAAPNDFNVLTIFSFLESGMSVYRAFSETTFGIWDARQN